MRFKLFVLATLMVVSAACGSTAPSALPPTGEAAGKPTPVSLATYQIWNIQVGPPDLMPNDYGNWPVSVNPKQPLTAGQVSLKGAFSGAGSGNVYAYLIKHQTLVDGTWRCFKTILDSTQWDTRCGQYERPIAGPVHVVNGESVVLGYISGLTSPASADIVYFTVSGGVQGMIDSSITEQR